MPNQPLARLLLTMSIALAPENASGQDWLTAYDRGDYETASTLLHRTVLEADDTFAVDPAAIARLGRMYSEGRAVRQDLVMACALYNLGAGATAFRHNPDHPMTAAAEVLRDRECARLTDAQREEAMLLVGAVFFGPDERTFSLAGDHTVRVSRSGVEIEFKGEARRHYLPASVNHGQQVALVRHTRLDRASSPDDPQPRHFLEFFVWMSGPDSEGGLRRILVWTLAEVDGLALKRLAEQAVVHGAGSIWPAPDVPAAVRDAISLEMQPGGGVRWVLPGEGTARIVGGTR
jgi:hypothetical protein